MNKEQLKKKLDSAYLWLSRIPVSGEAVDAMAMARQELRAAFQLLNETEEVKNDG